MRGRIAATVALAAGLGSAPALGAALWPGAGGDPGRSGFQPLARPDAPLTQLWAADRPADRDVRTSILVTGGREPRVVYGTADGALHVRDLFTGRLIGDGKLTEFGNKDVWSGTDGVVSPVIADEQVYAVVNDRGRVPADPEAEDDPDLVIAHLDAKSGKVQKRLRIPDTGKYIISSSPFLGEPNSAGDRSLIFVATNRPDWLTDDTRSAGPMAVSRVFRIPIKAAQSERSSVLIEEVETEDIQRLTPLASPTLAVFDDHTSRSSPQAPKAYATLSSGSPTAPLVTRHTDSLADAGPGSPRLHDTASNSAPVYAMTPSVPVTPAGDAPGTGGSGAARAPAILVATWETRLQRATVHRLVRQPQEPSMAAEDIILDAVLGPPAPPPLIEAARSARLPGKPAAQLAVAQNEQGPGGGAGLVLVTTGRNLYALDGGDLSTVWKLDPGDALVPGATGFSRTTPVIVGDVVVAVRDDGRPLALELATGRVLSSGEFRVPSVSVSVGSYGAPAATRHGIVLMGSDRGVLAMSSRCGNAVPNTGGTLTGTLAGDTITGGGSADTLVGLAGDDCLNGNAGDDLASGGGGEDRIDLGPGADRAQGGDGDDLVLGGEDRDVLDGEDGDDRVEGGFGNDSVKGGRQKDRLEGGPGDDRLFGEADPDDLQGGSGDDRLSGGPARDRLVGSNGADVLTGGTDNDELVGGPGSDRFDGGFGNDLIHSRDGSAEIVRCGGGRDKVIADLSDRLVRCEFRVDLRGRKIRIRPRRSR